MRMRVQVQMQSLLGGFAAGHANRHSMSPFRWLSSNHSSWSLGIFHTRCLASMDQPLGMSADEASLAKVNPWLEACAWEPLDVASHSTRSATPRPRKQSSFVALNRIGLP